MLDKQTLRAKLQQWYKVADLCLESKENRSKYQVPTNLLKNKDLINSLDPACIESYDDLLKVITVISNLSVFSDSGTVFRQFLRQFDYEQLSRLIGMLLEMDDHYTDRLNQAFDKEDQRGQKIFMGKMNAAINGLSSILSLFKNHQFIRSATRDFLPAMVDRIMEKGRHADLHKLLIWTDQYRDDRELLFRDNDLLDRMIKILLERNFPVYLMQTLQILHFKDQKEFKKYKLSKEYQQLSPSERQQVARNKYLTHYINIHKHTITKLIDDIIAGLQNGTTDRYNLGELMSITKFTPIGDYFIKHKDIGKVIPHILNSNNPFEISKLFNYLSVYSKLEWCEQYPKEMAKAAFSLKNSNNPSIYGKLYEVFENNPNSKLKAYFNDNVFLEKSADNLIAYGTIEDIFNMLQQSFNNSDTTKNQWNIMQYIVERNHLPKLLDRLMHAKNQDKTWAIRAIYRIRMTEGFEESFISRPDLEKFINKTLRYNNPQHIAYLLDLFGNSSTIEYCWKDKELFKNAVDVVLTEPKYLPRILRSLRYTEGINYFLEHKNFKAAIRQVEEQGSPKDIAYLIVELINIPGYNREILGLIKRLKGHMAVLDTARDIDRDSSIQMRKAGEGVGKFIYRDTDDIIFEPDNSANYSNRTQKTYAYYASVLNAITKSELYSNDSAIQRQYVSMVEEVYNAQLTNIGNIKNVEITNNQLSHIVNLLAPLAANIAPDNIVHNNAKKISERFVSLFEEAIKRIPDNQVYNYDTLKHFKSALLEANSRDSAQVRQYPELKARLDNAIELGYQKLDKIVQQLIKDPSLDHEVLKANGAFTTLLSLIWQLEVLSDSSRVEYNIQRLKKSHDSLKKFAEGRLAAINKLSDLREDVNIVLLFTILKDLNANTDPKQLTEMGERLEEWLARIGGGGKGVAEKGQYDVYYTLYDKFNHDLKEVVIQPKHYKTVKRFGTKVQDTIRYDPASLTIGNEVVDDIIYVEFQGNWKRKQQLLTLIKYEGEYYLAGIIGGSSLKAPKDSKGQKIGDGKVMAVKLKALFGKPASNLRQLLNAPNKEHFYYFGRELFAGIQELKYRYQPKAINSDELLKSEILEEDTKHEEGQEELSDSLNEDAVKNKSNASNNSYTAAKMLTGRINIYHASNGFEIHPDLPLCIHDGCGAIKESVVNKMFTVETDLQQNTANEQQQAMSNVLDIEDDDSPHYAYDPFQSIQEIHRTFDNAEVYDAAVKEIVDRAINKLRVSSVPQGDDDQKTEQELDQLNAGMRRLYTTVTTGDPPVQYFVAIPLKEGSGVDIMVPFDLNEHDGTITGRNPYDKNNSVATSAKTSDYLKNAYGVQSTIFGMQSGKNNKKESTFYKGNQVVIPDKYWPKGLEDVDVIVSVDDRKIVSSILTREETKPAHHTRTVVHGYLAPTQFYYRGRFVLVNPTTQKYLGGDYDGDEDPIKILRKDSAEYKLYEMHRGLFFRTNGKLYKTSSDSLGTLIRAGQMEQIKDPLLGQFTVAYNLFVAFNERTKQDFVATLLQAKGARELIKEILGDEHQAYEDTFAPDIEGFYNDHKDIDYGIEFESESDKRVRLKALCMAQFEEEKRKRLEEDVPFDQLIRIVLGTGIKTGTDGFKTSVPIGPLKKFYDMFSGVIYQMDIPQPIYSKSLRRVIENNTKSLEELIAEAEGQAKYFEGTLPFDVTRGVLKKMKELQQQGEKIPLAVHLNGEGKNNPQRKKTGKGVTIIVTDRQGRILIGTQKDKRRGRAEHYIVPPGGKVDRFTDGKYKCIEDDLVAAARELWEETGIRLFFGPYDDQILEPEDLRKFNDDLEFLELLAKQLQLKEIINNGRNTVYNLQFDPQIHRLDQVSNKSDALDNLCFVKPDKLQQIVNKTPRPPFFIRVMSSMGLSLHKNEELASGLTNPQDLFDKEILIGSQALSNTMQVIADDERQDMRQRYEDTKNQLRKKDDLLIQKEDSQEPQMQQGNQNNRSSNRRQSQNHRIRDNNHSIRSTFRSGPNNIPLDSSKVY